MPASPWSVEVGPCQEPEQWLLRLADESEKEGSHDDEY
jgi:hypothetical protein